MTYLQQSSAGRSPAAIALVGATHAGIGYALLTFLGVTPAPDIDRLLPMDVVHIDDDRPVDPPAPPPETNNDPIEVAVKPPVVELVPSMVEKPFTRPKTPPMPELPSLPRAEPVSDPYFPIPPSDPVFVDSKLDPRFMARFQPPYPSASRRLEEQGTVLVDVQIDADGRVTSASIATSSGYRRLDEAALRQAERRWRFVPAMRDGVAVPSSRRIGVKFELKTG
ncbi:MAG: TonB family protein [Pacificimonas sp.]